MKLRNDLTQKVQVPFESTDWIPSPEDGVERKLLERDGGEVARATSFVRYAAGSTFPAHSHELGEEFVVLEGTFCDEHGDYPAGTYVRNPPGSRHRPFSSTGCTLFVKLRQFELSDQRRCVMALNLGLSSSRESPRQELHCFGCESVSCLRMARGAVLTLEGAGVELLVLTGELDVDGVRFAAWSWLRAPQLIGPASSATGCVVWLKQGHLGQAAP